MKSFIALISLFISAPMALASSHAQGGTYYVCYNADESPVQVTLTANLPDRESESTAVLKIDGVPKEYFKIKHNKPDYVFLVGKRKNSTLEIKKTATSATLISLETDPDKSEARVLHKADELGMTITEIHSVLNIPSENIKDEPVTCKEAKWIDNPDAPPPAPAMISI